MPLRPLHIAQSSARSESQILPGSIVEYEQHGKIQLAFAVQEKKGKWLVVNQAGAEVELQALRLALLPGQIPDSLNNTKEKTKHLEDLVHKAVQRIPEVNLEELWEVVQGELKEASIKDLSEVALGDNSLSNHLTMRRALLDDRIYFKRSKTGFEPRPPDTVEQLKIQREIEDKKKQQREELISALLRRIRGEDVQLPKGTSGLEQLSALGRSADNAKETTSLVEEVLERANLAVQGRPEWKAFQVLLAAKHFSPDENLTLIRLGCSVDFPQAILEEADELFNNIGSFKYSQREDLQALTTFTIDDSYTRDVDDALSLEKLDDGFRIGIHISDVSASILQDSPLEDIALDRATSIYCPDQHIPMLPKSISENALSLVQGEKRPSMSFFIDMDESCAIKNRRICRSFIEVGHRLDYDQVDRLLYGSDSELSGLSANLSETLLFLWNVASTLEGLRLSAGAIQFSRREMTPKILEDGSISLEESSDDTPARKLVSELMILANETAALFARDNGFPIIFRGQEYPDVDIYTQGLDIPEGPARDYFQRGFIKRSVLAHEPLLHSGLGLEAYTYVTSPIRRAIDLINQRQIAAFLDNKTTPYTIDDLAQVTATIAEGLEKAVRIQRERNRYWLQKYLVQEGIRELGGMIIRVDTSRPLAELDILHSLYPFHPQKTKGSVAIEKRRGERVKLKIDSIDPRREILVLREE